MWHGIHGHDSVVQRFSQSLASGRLGSCYLFLGPAGIGKHTFALKLAQALLCQNASGSSLDPCGSCEACQLMASTNHPDLDLIGLPAGKNRLPVELFIGDRDHRHQEGLCHSISLCPRLGSHRVAIVDDADCLTVESSNSLLKTLEEPPRGAILILIGTSRSRQLPTILSRIQIVPFNPLPVEAVASLLIEQQIVSDPTRAHELAQHSHGSLSRALEFADPELGALRDQLHSQFQPTAFDSVRLASELIAQVNQAGKEANVRRQRLRAIFHMSGDLFRSVLRASSGVSDDHNKPQGKTLQAWIRQGESVQGHVLAALDRCLEAEQQLDRNANQATLLECWLDDLAEIFSPMQDAESRV